MLSPLAESFELLIDVLEKAAVVDDFPIDVGFCEVRIHPDSWSNQW